jgi:hypothetical protein
LLPENVPERCGDLRGAEKSGCYLIEEGLKQMKVPFINEGDFNGQIIECSNGRDPAESSSDDHYLMRFIYHSFLG